MAEKDIFTILYEIKDQKYLIGVTNDFIPTIAAMGVNTPRPLPTNVKTALIKTVMEIRKMRAEPKFIDYNAPSENISKSVLGNFSIRPMDEFTRSARSVSEVLTELKIKMGREER
jgi:hypothetical protein